MRGSSPADRARRGGPREVPQTTGSGRPHFVPGGGSSPPSAPAGKAAPRPEIRSSADSSRSVRADTTCPFAPGRRCGWTRPRSEEHTSELQSRENLVCRLLLEKKKKQIE